jgi:hypothetical protein
MAVIPGDDEQLVVKTDTTVHILARDIMSVVRCLELPTSSGFIAASERFFMYYIAGGFQGNKGVHCLTHDGTEVMSCVDQAKLISHPVLGPEGLLFCLLHAHDVADGTQDEIMIVLDHRALRPLHRLLWAVAAPWRTWDGGGWRGAFGRMRR